jgi:CcmD family protein
MIQLASTLPSNDGYVAAAYIMFFALILIYVVVMAVRLTRVERRLRELQREHGGDLSATSDKESSPQRDDRQPGGERADATNATWEREVV